VAQGRAMMRIAGVQNMYNLAHRNDDALIDSLAKDGIAYVPFFPLGGFSPLQADALSHAARQCNATPMQVALAWLLQRSPNILLIPGTSSVAHLKQNIESVNLQLPENALSSLDSIGSAKTQD
jgi:pyridoxine 4-dehydrogenase